jgi:hypothetical protein
MKHVNTWWMPWYRNERGAWGSSALIMKLGWINQHDYFFIQLFFIEIIITKKKYRNRTDYHNF